jgi:hypothetical protein
MILMLAPGPGIVYGAMPSGAAYISSPQSLVFITNNSSADQVELASLGCKTLSPFGDWGNLGFFTLADLYAYDVADPIAQYTIASVFADPTAANDGTWAKTGSGAGTGNWTQVSTLTLASIWSSLGAETARAENAENALGARITTETARAEEAEESILALIEGLASGWNIATGGPVAAATTGALPSNTYANGSEGVGATLTATASGALAAQDGITLSQGQRLLVKNEAAPANNGVYVVTQLGSSGTPYILTRAFDANSPATLAALLVFVESGTTLAGDTFVLPLAVSSITVGTTALEFYKATVANVGGGVRTVTASFTFGSAPTDLGGRVFCVLTAAATATMPTSPTIGDTYRWKDAGGNFGTCNLTFETTDGSTLDGQATQTAVTNGAYGAWIYMGAGQWGSV